MVPRTKHNRIQQGGVCENPKDEIGIAVDRNLRRE